MYCIQCIQFMLLIYKTRILRIQPSVAMFGALDIFNHHVDIPNAIQPLLHAQCSQVRGESALFSIFGFLSQPVLSLDWSYSPERPKPPRIRLYSLQS